MSYDYLVVGAGFAGSVVAERLAAEHDKRVLVIDRRGHVGGNAYDHFDDAGILVHKYGPHIFHTSSPQVFAYLSRFTEWRRYEHWVQASVGGSRLPFPINIDTVNRLYGTRHDATSLEAYFDSVAEHVAHPRTSEEAVVGKIGRHLYDLFFKGYTRKQWGIDASELDASVAARVPARLNHDARYFTDEYQAMPRLGYSHMFGRMLAHPNIDIALDTDYREVRGRVAYDSLIFTGPIDEYFDHRLGRLPYRSIEFRHETHAQEQFQGAPVVNYPNDHEYTRVTEFKYLTGQTHAKTSVVYEIPCEDGDPYYPVPRRQNAELYRRYRALADATPKVHFAGRLGTYKYYNMDQVVAQALTLVDRIQKGTHAATAA